MSSLIYTDHANKSRGREFLFLMKAAKKKKKKKGNKKIKPNLMKSSTKLQF